MLGFFGVFFLVSMLTVRHGTMNSVQCYSLALQLPCNWLQRAQKLRSHNSENPALSKIIYDAFETAADQNVAMHVSPTVRNSAFLIYAFLVHSTSHLFQTLFKHQLANGTNGELDFCPLCDDLCFTPI